MSDIEVVSVFHNNTNRLQALDMRDAVAKFEPDVKVHLVDNTVINRGFTKGCNLGAVWCKSRIIGFINPDALVSGFFVQRVLKAFNADPKLVITGERYDKTDREIRIWGCHDWVCGAAMFVDREWFMERGGFDTRYFMYFEETDLIRQAQTDGRTVRSISLPIFHSSPSTDGPRARKFKANQFAASARLFEAKWKLKPYSA